MRGLFGTALAAALAAATATAGEPAAPIATDANIVTGLDASDLVSSAQLRLELAGLAEALRSPEVLAAVRRGRHGRIGFAVFLWYQRHFPVVAAWRVIASQADAEAAARALAGFDIAAFTVAAYRRERFYAGRLTDLSQALDHGRNLLDAAPFAAGRGVLNLIGNGEDNVGEPVDAGAGPRARRRPHRQRRGGRRRSGDFETYFRDRVTGGWGAFVLAAEAAPSLVAAMQRKLTADLIAAPSIRFQDTFQTLFQTPDPPPENRRRQCAAAPQPPPAGRRSSGTSRTIAAKSNARHQENVREGHDHRLPLHHTAEPAQRARRRRRPRARRLERLPVDAGEPLLGHRRAPGDCSASRAACRIGAALQHGVDRARARRRRRGCASG